MYGIIVKGEDSQLILGDDKPIITQKYRGRIKATSMFPDNTAGVPTPNRVAIATVQYPEPLSGQSPPMVFGIPTTDLGVAGIGYFAHEGGQGNWTGFSMIIARDWRLRSAPTIGVGFDSGWEYSVCVAGDPEVEIQDTSSFGLQVRGEDGTMLYNTNWPLVTFKGLLPNWTSGEVVRRVGDGYWMYPAKGRDDNIVMVADHQWGYEDGNFGIMISSLGLIPLRFDVGKKDTTKDSVVVVGFNNGDRSTLKSAAVADITGQHPTANITALNDWKLLVADFSHVR